MSQIIEGLFELLTPFPKASYEDAKRYRIELEKKPKSIRGLHYLMPYMVKSRGEVLLVDCGWNTDEAFNALDTEMKLYGSNPAEINRLFVTHVHPDHYGMAGRLKQIAQLELILHEKDAEHINSRYFAPRGLTDQMGTFMEQNGVPAMDSPSMAGGSMGMLQNVAPVPPDTQVKGGEVFKVGDFDFQIIWTPGHTPGHICLYEPNRKLLFTGDHILPIITPNVSIHAQTTGNPLGDYMKSLRMLLAFDVDWVLPAHEWPTRNLKERIQELEGHHEERLQEMLDGVDGGGATAWEVASRVKWSRGMLSDFEPHQQRSAVGETISHLEFLYEEGKLAKVQRDHVIYWLPV